MSHHPPGKSVCYDIVREFSAFVHELVSKPSQAKLNKPVPENRANSHSHGVQKSEAAHVTSVSLATHTYIQSCVH